MRELIENQFKINELEHNMAQAYGPEYVHKIGSRYGDVLTLKGMNLEQYFNCRYGTSSKNSPKKDNKLNERPKNSLCPMPKTIVRVRESNGN